MAAERYEIRHATASDIADGALLETLVEIVNAGYHYSESGIWSPEFRRTDAEELSKIAAAGELLLAVDRVTSAVVGQVKLSREDARPDLLQEQHETWNIGLLAVCEHCRGQGIGGLLIWGCESRALALGAEYMTLELLVPVEWQHPVKDRIDSWYRRLGYEFQDTKNFKDIAPSHFHQWLMTGVHLNFYRKRLA